MTLYVKKEELPEHCACCGLRHLNYEEECSYCYATCDPMPCELPTTKERSSFCPLEVITFPNLNF